MSFVLTVRCRVSQSDQDRMLWVCRDERLHALLSGCWDKPRMTAPSRRVIFPCGGSGGRMRLAAQVPRNVMPNHCAVGMRGYYYVPVYCSRLVLWTVHIYYTSVQYVHSRKLSIPYPLSRDSLRSPGFPVGLVCHSTHNTLYFALFVSILVRHVREQVYMLRDLGPESTLTDLNVEHVT